MYAFLRGDTPFCPPAGSVRQMPPWSAYDGLPGNVQATFQRAPLHALVVSRSYITYDEAMSTFPQWMAGAAQAFSQWIESWLAQDYPSFWERSYGVCTVLGRTAWYHGTRLGRLRRTLASGVCKPSGCREHHGLAP